ncbi:hypothetical protein AMATHDRAFT_142046 [Amanita thiersii Skay4041]|uniref:Cytochrome P450 n=1 Tax=Amanita thiersii Skay4041 TaxID=703135 RepID=A0A2A9NTH3_9AGAR|nr:hypothetical protein AMATHDRAFT_142046 [Amanita thiersii Skay4041]
MSASAFAGLACLLVALFIWLRKPKASTASLPPGPKPLPLLGNLKDLTAQELWLPASKWAKEFGDIVYVHVFGQGLVFLNSPEAAFDLLDKRGSIYSDKPQLVMAGELCGCKHMVAFTSYGEESRRQRKIMTKAFGIPSIPAYHPLINTETHSFLRRLISDPSNYVKHTRRYAGGLTLSVVYGYEATSNDDEFLAAAEDCVDILSNHIASGGGIWPVDILPFLQRLPASLPGMGFKRKAVEWKAKMEDFVDKPYEFVKTAMKTGNYKPSFCSTMLDDNAAKITSEFEFDLKWTANSMYSASADTTITAVSHFLLAMMAYPEALARAQDEIDAVVGSERLPAFEDRPSLPFVDAVMSEVLRWGVPVPLNLPHRLMEDDVYKGMHIPKGSLIFGNIWAIMHDESIYADPYMFKPERFLEPVDEAIMRRRNPRNYVFGFGRRICPGKNLVESSIWLVIASMIATLDIKKAVDEQGNVIEPEVKFENPIFRIPNPFVCDIRPRSEKALRLIRQSEFM